MGDLPTERAVFVPTPFAQQPLLEDAEREATDLRSELRLLKSFGIALQIAVALAVALTWNACRQGFTSDAEAALRMRVDLAESRAAAEKRRAERLRDWWISDLAHLNACERERDAPRVLHVRPDGSFMWTGVEVGP